MARLASTAWRRAVSRSCAWAFSASWVRRCSVISRDAVKMRVIRPFSSWIGTTVVVKERPISPSSPGDVASNVSGTPVSYTRRAARDIGPSGGITSRNDIPSTSRPGTSARASRFTITTRSCGPSSTVISTGASSSSAARRCSSSWLRRSASRCATWTSTSLVTS